MSRKIRFFIFVTLACGAGAVGADSGEVRLDTLSLPEGFAIEGYAEVPGARSLAYAPSTGTVFVGTRGSEVFAVTDANGDHKADRVITLMDDLKVGNGVAIRDGDLYVAEQHRISRITDAVGNLATDFADKRETIFDELPDKSHHGWRYIAFSPEDKLYVTVGAPCNICDPAGIEASIIRMNPDGSDMEVYARGIRNSVGTAFQPDSGTLYFTDNGVDRMGDERPAGELNAAPRAGLHFGFPYYGGGHDRHTDWADKQPPEQVTFPVVEFRAHVAPLGLSFVTGDMFPDDYQGDAIVAQHGSWNRTTPIGYRLMRVTFDDSGQATGKEIFIDGWLQDGQDWGRPVDTLELPDGSLLVSDDTAGVIYRVTHEGGSQ